VIGTVSEAAGAGLVLAETCILFAGVVSRYVFDNPLMWTDELANFLFLWLAMLGTVVALRRNEHMRLTTLINSLSPKRGQWLSTVGALVVIVFVLEILVPAAQYLEVQRSTELITLSISDGYRVVAILVGATLTALIALLRLLEQIIALSQLWGVGLVIIEDTASGMGLIQLLQEQTRLSVVGRNSNVDKVTRMSRQQGRFEAGRILLPNEAPWLAEFENELLAFPYGRYDDQVDALLLFLDWFTANEQYLRPMVFCPPIIVRQANPFPWPRDPWPFDS
jgi:predicted phage terminase large subunit-like protein